MDWPSAVRRWSEEVFIQVAENRGVAGVTTIASNY